MKRAYNEYDIMKVLLLVLVVVAHVTRMYTPVGAIPVYGCNEWLSVMTDYIYSFHMPAFIAVSGMTFSMSMRKLESNDYSKMGGGKKQAPTFDDTLCIFFYRGGIANNVIHRMCQY